MEEVLPINYIVKLFIAVNESDLGAAASHIVCHIQQLSRLQVASQSYFCQVSHIQFDDWLRSLPLGFLQLKLYTKFEVSNVKQRYIDENDNCACAVSRDL